MNTFTTTTNENTSDLQAQTLHQAVSDAASNLLSTEKSGGLNLYKSLLDIIEPPLLKAMMEHFRYNQSKVARVLGLSRGTLRRKLIEHFDDKYCSTRDLASEE